jgi:hypothetical protein
LVAITDMFRMTLSVWLKSSADMRCEWILSIYPINSVSYYILILECLCFIKSVSPRDITVFTFKYVLQFLLVFMSYLMNQEQPWTFWFTSEQLQRMLLQQYCQSLYGDRWEIKTQHKTSYSNIVFLFYLFQGGTLTLKDCVEASSCSG